MKSLTIALSLALLAGFATPVQAASCTVQPTLNVAGLLYMHVNPYDNLDYYYAESNNDAGLQVGATHYVFGWGETGYEHCTGGDILLY